MEKETNWTKRMKNLLPGQMFITDKQFYESLITVAGRLKRKGIGKYSVSIKSGYSTVTCKTELIAEKNN